MQVCIRTLTPAPISFLACAKLSRQRLRRKRLMVQQRYGQGYGVVVHGSRLSSS
jgi:hypothetical protein